MLINLHYIGESFISGQNILSSIAFFDPGKPRNEILKPVYLFLVMEYVNNGAAIVYMFIRIISLALTVMTFHLGFTRQPEINWNTKNTRYFALCIVSLVQVNIPLSVSLFRVNIKKIFRFT